MLLLGLAGGAAWAARAFVLPAAVALVAAAVPGRRSDPRRHAGSLRDPLAARPASVRRTMALALVWLRAFYGSRRGLRRLATLLEFPTVLAKLCCFRFLPRHVVVADETEVGASLLTLRLADDGSWWLADLAAWPRGRRISDRLVERVLDAADVAGRTIHLTSANRALAAGYYARLGFRPDPSTITDARPLMTRLPTPPAHRI